MDIVSVLLIALFPAHAGVIPLAEQLSNGANPFPRACGGDPTTDHAERVSCDFSPRMRG